MIKLAAALFEYGGDELTDAELLKMLAAATETLETATWLDCVVMPSDSGSRDVWFTRFEKEWESPWEVVIEATKREFKEHSGDAVDCLVIMINHADAYYGETLSYYCENLLRDRREFILELAERFDAVGWFVQLTVCEMAYTEERERSLNVWSAVPKNKASATPLRWLDCGNPIERR